MLLVGVQAPAITAKRGYGLYIYIYIHICIYMYTHNIFIYECTWLGWVGEGHYQGEESTSKMELKGYQKMLPSLSCGFREIES